MKITIGTVSVDILLPFRLWLPSIVLIIAYTFIFFGPFHMLLLTLSDVARDFVGIAWWSLLILFISMGVAYTYFYARFFRASFGSESALAQRIMAILSGAPFYALGILFVLYLIYCLFIATDVPAPAAFVSVLGTVVFALVSGAYLLLLRFFLRRIPAVAQQ